MDFTQPGYTLQARNSILLNILSGLKKVFLADTGLVVQVIMTVPIVFAGIALNINAVQWVLVVFVTLLFLLAGIFRTAALLQARQDTSLSPFHVSRIRCMGTFGVVLTSGISLFTYMMVFVPKIILYF